MATLDSPYFFQSFKYPPIRRCRKFLTFPLSKLPSLPSQGLSEMEDPDLVLLGEFHGRRWMSEDVMRAFVAANWRVRHIPQVTHREDNVWVFRFFSYEERQEVFQNGPFEIEGALFAFARPTSEDPFPSVDFTRVPIWIELRRLPHNLMTRQNVEFLASHVGTVIWSEMRRDRDWVTAYPRLYVYLNVFNPVLPSVGVGDEDDPDEVLISYRGFQPCRRCGCLGHSRGRCRASEGLVIQELNAMLQRVSHNGGVGPITDINHALYTTANRGQGLLNNWIPYNPIPELNTPNQGGYRPNIPSPRGMHARPPSSPRASRQLPVENGFHIPASASNQTRPMPNGSANRGQVRPFYAIPGRPYPTVSIQPTTQIERRNRVNGHDYHFQGPVTTSPLNLDQVLHLENSPVRRHSVENRQWAQPAESDATLIIYANDSDIPVSEAATVHPLPNTPIPSESYMQGVEFQAQQEHTGPVHRRYPLNPSQVPWAPPAVANFPQSPQQFWEQTSFFLQQIFQALFLRDVPGPSQVPVDLASTHTARRQSTPIASVSPVPPVPIYPSPRSVLQVHTCPPSPVENIMDAETYAEQVVLLEQFQIQQEFKQSEPMQLARSVTSPVIEEPPQSFPAIQEEEVRSPSYPQPQFSQAPLQIRDSQQSAAPPRISRFERFSRRGRREGKAPMEEGESSSRRQYRINPPWPSVLGVRERVDDSLEETRQLRRRLDLDTTASSSVGNQNDQAGTAQEHNHSPPI